MRSPAPPRPSPANEALANGQLDFAYQGDLPALVAKAGGPKLILAVNRAEGRQKPGPTVGKR